MQKLTWFVAGWIALAACGGDDDDNNPRDASASKDSGLKQDGTVGGDTGSTTDSGTARPDGSTDGATTDGSRSDAATTDGGNESDARTTDGG